MLIETLRLTRGETSIPSGSVRPQQLCPGLAARSLSPRDVEELLTATSEAQGKIASVLRVLQYEEMGLRGGASVAQPPLRSVPATSCPGTLRGRSALTIIDNPV